MTFRRLLWFHDLSERSAAAAPVVVQLARALHLEVVLAHAMDDVTELERARSILAVAQAGLDEAGVVGTAVALREGRPVAVAQDLVASLGADLVVVGRTGHGGLDRLLLGSTARKLVRELSVPVLVARDPGGTVHSVLCATAPGDDADASMIVAAADLAEALGASLTYLAVVEATLGVELDDERRAEAQLRNHVDACLRADPTRTTVLARVDETAEQGILTEASRHDLVVLRTHGRHGLSRVLQGSVAEGVVERCPAPVLVLR